MSENPPELPPPHLPQPANAKSWEAKAAFLNLVAAIEDSALHDCYRPRDNGYTIVAARNGKVHDLGGEVFNIEAGARYRLRDVQTLSPMELSVIPYSYHGKNVLRIEKLEPKGQGAQSGQEGHLLDARSEGYGELFTLCDVIVRGYLGASPSRLTRNTMVGNHEYICVLRPSSAAPARPHYASADSVMIWPEAYRPHYMRKHNVPPTKRFYDFVLSFVRDRRPELAKTAAYRKAAATPPPEFHAPSPDRFLPAEGYWSPRDWGEGYDYRGRPLKKRKIGA